MNRNELGLSGQNAKPSSEGTDVGSAMILVFTEQTWKLVVGHSKGDFVWKFPCGKIEEQDYTPDDSAHQEEGVRLSGIALRCALRELKGETGLTEHDLSFVHQLEYIRRWSRVDWLSHRQKMLHQFHFIAMIKEGITLPITVDEEEEMDERAYWSADDILKRAFQPRYSKNKFNPVHAIVLAKTLQSLKKTIGRDPNFVGFHQLMRKLTQKHLNVETLAGELDHLINAHQI